MKQIRDKYCYVFLTEEEEAILYKRTEELGMKEEEFIGKAIKIYDDLLNYIDKISGEKVDLREGKDA